MSFRTSAAFTAAMADKRPSLAVVTGGKSGIGLALAKKIASFDFIDQVLAVSRSAKQQELQSHHPKLVAVPADISTEEGRQVVVDKVKDLCGETKQLRFLIHSAGSIDPIKPVFELKPEELRHSMVLNCEAPLFLSTALYKFMKPIDDKGVPGRVVSTCCRRIRWQFWLMGRLMVLQFSVVSAARLIGRCTRGPARWMGSVRVSISKAPFIFVFPIHINSHLYVSLIQQNWKSGILPVVSHFGERISRSRRIRCCWQLQARCCRHGDAGCYSRRA